MARIFVTGASGFIGGALATRLHERGEDVVGLARSDASAAKLGARGLKVVRGDVLDEDSLAAGMAGCELVYHCAGVNSHCPPDPEAAAAGQRGRAPSSSCRRRRAPGCGASSTRRRARRWGRPTARSATSAPCTAARYLSVYDRSKHLGEQAAFAAAHRTGVEVVAICPSSVQGPGRTSGNGKLIMDYVNGKLPVFVDTYISIVDIADCTEAHILAAERGRAGARYVLNGATITSAEALDLVAQVSGVRHRVRIVSPPVARSAAALLEAAYKVRGRVPSLCRARIRTFLHGHQYDGSLATRELGLVYTPVAETFRRTIEWAVHEGLVTRPITINV